MFYVYALYNHRCDKIYVGQTNNVSRRLMEHNFISSHYTGKIVGKWELIYSEEYENRSAAMAREKQLKSHRGRDFIRRQINNLE